MSESGIGDPPFQAGAVLDHQLVKLVAVSVAQLGEGRPLCTLRQLGGAGLPCGGASVEQLPGASQADAERLGGRR